MKVGSILNFKEWARIASSSSTKLRKAEIFISIYSKVMSQILTAIFRVFVNFILHKKFFKLSSMVFFYQDESNKNVSLTIEQFFFDENNITGD
jgi:hypothetical protein